MPVLSMTTTSGPSDFARYTNARLSRLKLPNSRVSIVTLPSACSVTAQALILAWCTSSPMREEVYRLP